MRTTQALTITLPLEMARMVKQKVLSGEYATESEVIRDGLRTLASRDKAIERWLLEEVAATARQARENPEELLSADQVQTNLRTHVESMTAKPRSNA